ncbi:MAG: hypothetical protein LBB91_12245 [Clostridiales bacterium]|jgi:hypothetical protein|nr:hypothetical protein [Clostridiales bacterium]
MVESGESKKNQDPLDFVKALDQTTAIRILLQLCQEKAIAEQIIDMAKVTLSEVSAQEIAEEVFESLNSILVEDLWDNSGKTRYGYEDPADVAFEMIETEADEYVQEMLKYRQLGMKREEKAYCQGILEGILKYGNEGTNDFHDWAPDDPYTIADNIFQEWKTHNTEEDIKDIQAIYTSYFG